MKSVVVLLSGQSPAVAASLAASGLVSKVVVQLPPGSEPVTEVAGLPCETRFTDAPGCSEELSAILEGLDAPFLLQVVGDADPHPTAPRRLVQAATDAGAPLVYGDYVDELDGAIRPHPLAPLQEGSLEDSFDLGPLRLWSVAELNPLPDGLRWHGWYALRLGAQDRVLHLAEPLCTLRPQDLRASGQRVFDYLTAGRERQVEAEAVLTEHLRQQEALVGPAFRRFDALGEYPVEASVVIPVRNRVTTVLDAVDSALGQQAPFAFNVIVVDNHSSDGTTEVLAAHADPRLVHLRPTRHDLGIGGCWNEAVNDPRAGRYVVQLDSDDLYAGTDTLARMVALLREQRCGMAVGSYTLVDFDLNPIPPGLIDHREWTEDNGPNNALRVGGLGAPRAFATELVRRHPFPNASYGEDYAVALRISREYHVGRITESVYLCRRWEDNSDADLDPAVKARYQAFKDRLRTVELRARRARR